MFITVFNNKVVQIDKEDYQKVSSLKWHVLKNGYVSCSKYVRGSGRKNQKTNFIYLHRFIMGAKKGEYVDHINRNTLDNRKSNLRICSQSQNMANSTTPKNNTTGHKGIYWHKAAKKWEAAIHYLNKKHYIGLFKNKESAIEARKIASNYYFGEFGG